MNAGSNGPSSGGYRGGVKRGGHTPGMSDRSNMDQIMLGAQRLRQHGDSFFVGARLPRKAPSKATKAPMDPKQVLRVTELTRTVSFGVAGFALFFFILMILQPILLPLLTLGYCFSGGVAEWLDFSWTVLKVSVIPAAIAVCSGWIGYFAQRRVKQLSEKLLEEGSQPSMADAAYSPELMARLSSNDRMPSSSYR